MDIKGTDESLRSSFYLPSISSSWQRFFFFPRGLQSIKYTYLWSERFSMATENLEMPFFSIFFLTFRKSAFILHNHDTSLDMT